MELFKVVLYITIFFILFCLLLKCIDRILNYFSVDTLLVFYGFTIPYIAFCLLVFKYEYAINDSLVSASTLSLALNAMVTLLITFKKKINNESSKENIK